MKNKNRRFIKKSVDVILVTDTTLKVIIRHQYSDDVYKQVRKYLLKSFGRVKQDPKKIKNEHYIQIRAFQRDTEIMGREITTTREDIQNIVDVALQDYTARQISAPKNVKSAQEKLNDAVKSIMGV